MAAYQGGQRSAAKSPRKPNPPRRPAARPTDKRANLPGGRAKPKPKPSAPPQRQGPAVPARLTKAPPAPKLPPPTRTTASRPMAARPAAKPKPKAPAKAKPTMASKPPVAQTSGIGPVRSGAAYASQKGSISESLRKIREMRAESTRRQTGQAAPALSGSKDYSSQFKDLKGGSARFTAELKKKKKLF